MGKKTKKPQIRFAGFTDDWEQRKLGATNTFFTDGNYGEAYPKSSDMTDSGSGIPFLTGGNLKDGKLSLDGASYITPEKHSKLTSGHLHEDDIVIAVRGSLGALGYVNTDNSGWNINSQLAILRTDKSELYGKFLIQYLLSWTGQNELLKRQTGSALKQLPIGAIKDVEVPITSIAEQGKIGEYFSNLDNLITLHQRKLDKLKSVKKSMLEKMIPQNGEVKPEIRFTGFTDDWEQRKLGELTTYRNGTGHEEKQSDVGKYELVNLNSISIDGGLKPSGKFIDEETETLIKDDLVMVLSDVGHGDLLGRVAIIPENNRFVLNQRVALLRNNGIADIKYLFSYINAHQRYFKLQGAGSSQLNISRGSVENFEVLLPSKDEQKKIGEYFSNLDSLITLHQRKLEKLKMIKRLLLEKMFI